MIKLTNKIFNNNDFLETLVKIYKNDDMPPKVAYHYNIIYKDILQKSQDYEDIKKKFVEKNGVPIEGVEGNYNIPKEYQQELQDLIDIKFELNHDLIPFHESMKLSPLDMETFKNIIDFTSLKKDDN